jgi:hypothetical protein
MPDKEWSRHSLINAYTQLGTTSPVETSVLDMNGFESVLFVVAATVTSTGNQLVVKGGTATATGAGFSEVFSPVGASHVVDTLYADVYRPTKRFIQGSFESSAASSPTVSITAIRYGGRSLPTTQEAETTGVRMYSPGSGTATATG